jgi:hypothetical protein
MAIDRGHRPTLQWRTTLVGGFLAFLCVLALQPLFVFSLVFFRSHADLDAIRTHVRVAYERGVLDVDEVPRLLIHRYGQQFSECVTIQLALDDERDAVTAALRPQLIGPFVGPCRELHDIVFGAPSTTRTDYSRYWHGYRIYLWPMLTHFDLATMRYINAVILIATLVLFFSGLRAALGPTAAIILFVTLMSLTDIWRIWRITQHFVSMVLILCGTGLFGLLYRRWRESIFAIVYAAIFGSIFGFTDALINPPMAPMLLAFLVLALDPALPRDAPFKDYRGPLAYAGLIAMSWFSGYALTWAMKWVIAIWISSDASAMAKNIFDQILLRTYGQEQEGTIYFIPLLPTLTMIVQAFISVGSLTVALIAAAIAFTLRDNWQAFSRKYFFVLVAPTLIPSLWFELLSNQTQTHSHFVYRSESASIAVVLASALLAMKRPPSVRDLWETLLRFPLRR